MYRDTHTIYSFIAKQTIYHLIADNEFYLVTNTLMYMYIDLGVLIFNNYNCIVSENDIN